MVAAAELPLALVNATQQGDSSGQPAELEWPFAINFVVTAAVGVSALAAGFLIDKIGSRRTILVGISIGGAGLALFGPTQNPWLTYPAFALVSMAATSGGWLPVMVALCRRFERPSVPIALTSTLGNIGKAIPVTGAIVFFGAATDAGWASWGTLAIATGAGLLAVALLAAPLMRRRGPQPAAAGGFTARQSLRTPAFRLILAGDVLAEVSAYSVIFWLPIWMTTQGYSMTTAALVITLYRVVSPFFILVGGYVGNRYSLRGGLAWFTVLQAAGIALLVFADGMALILLAAGVLAMGSGGRVAPHVTILFDYFGTASLGKILGWQVMAAWLLGWFFASMLGMIADSANGAESKSYIFAGLALLTLLGALCFLKARRPSPPEAAPAPQWTVLS